MQPKFLVIAAALATGVAFASPASANVFASTKAHVSTERSTIELVGHRHGGRCQAWRHECADRWGWGTWRFRRCVIAHGCV
ncbi:MAG: glycosyl hydrolase family 5 [Hyphomicrobium sp.]|jgi:hypothetical protein